MCLVSYVPIGKNDFCISSNRDESPSRATTQIQEEKLELDTIFYPADIKGGSWIIASWSKRSICLLNGAFVNHRYKGNYKYSRGILMKQFFEYDTSADFIQKISLDGIEPFTMIIRDHKNLFELRWDDHLKHVKILDIHKPYVWSSCTLYSEDAISRRESWFMDNLNNTEKLNAQSIINIHKSGGIKDRANGFLMNREDRVRTISISQILSVGLNYKLIHIPIEIEKQNPIIKEIHD